MSTAPPAIRPHRLGLDFGGVIFTIGQVPGHEIRASEDPDYLNRPAIPDAIESIKKLVQIFGPENVFIVSRVSADGEQKVRNWLYYHSFMEQTGMLRENVHFCRERHEKGPICEGLGITHFVDDRLECLVGMETVPHRYRLSGEPPDIEISFGKDGQPNRPTFYLPVVEEHFEGNCFMVLGYTTWPEIVKNIEGSIRRTS